MEKHIFILISLYGQKAVSLAYEVQNGYCYTRLTGKNEQKLAQMEVVIDESGLYKELEQKWVDVSVYEGQFEATLEHLRELGFTGCYAAVNLQNEEGCFFEPISETVYIQI